MISLAAYYESLGYSSQQWHMGSEHPALETYAIEQLRQMPNVRVLEVGYQAGAFAVPVILATHDRLGFEYVGIDSLEYPNAVNGRVIADYLSMQGVSRGYRFAVGDADVFLKGLPDSQPFDLILIDHYKPLYTRELSTVLDRGLLRPGGLIFLHDALAKARQAWKECREIAATYGYQGTLNEEIPDGLGILRLDSNFEAPRVVDRLRRKAYRARIRGQGVHRAVGSALHRWRQGLIRQKPG